MAGAPSCMLFGVESMAKWELGGINLLNARLRTQRDCPKISTVVLPFLDMQRAIQYVVTLAMRRGKSCQHAAWLFTLYLDVICFRGPIFWQMSRKIIPFRRHGTKQDRLSKNVGNKPLLPFA